MHYKFISIILFLVATLGYSQETPQSFSLQEAIDFALQNNRTAKNAARDTEAAEEQEWETTATGLPQISALVDYLTWLKQPVSWLPDAAFYNTQTTIDIVSDYCEANQRNSKLNRPEGLIPLRHGT